MSFRELDVPDFRRFREFVDHIPHYRDMILIKTLYLTAARVSEIVTKVTQTDLDRKKSDAYGTHLTWSLQDYQGEKLLLLTLRSAHKKAQRASYKMIALPTDPVYEPWTYDLMKWIRHYGTLAFNLQRRSVSRIVKKRMAGLHPDFYAHFLRHTRITHLATEYEFTPYDLTAVGGWSIKPGFAKVDTRTTGQPDTYLHYSWQQYLPKLLTPIQDVMKRRRRDTFTQLRS